MAKKLTLEEKKTYLQLAMSSCGYGIEDKLVELTVKMYDGILLKGGKFDLNDCVKIQHEVNGNHAKVEITAIPNESSTVLL